MKWRYIIMVAGVVALALALFFARDLPRAFQAHGFSVDTLLHEYPFMRAQFDRDEWNDVETCFTQANRDCADEIWDCRRGRMVSDLQERFLRPGVTSRNDMADLLGNPGPDISINGLTCNEWYVGACSGFKLDMDGFVACYDDAGILVDSFHRQH